MIDPVRVVPWLVRVTTGPADDDEVVPVEDDEVVPVDRVERSGDDTVWMTGRGRRFGAAATIVPVSDPDAGGWHVSLDVTLAADARPLDASVAVAIRVPADRDPDWLVPGVFVRDNRPAESRSRYPRWVPDGDAALTHDPFAASSWWLRSDRAATPSAFATGGGLRVALATGETSPLGATGVGFGTVTEESATAREVRLSFPYREEPIVYDGSPEPLPPDRPRHRWTPGETVRLEYRVHATPDGPDATAAILRSLADWLAPPAPLQPALDASRTADLAAEGLLRWHFRAPDSVLLETAAFERRGDGTTLEPGDRLAMHVAWLSGAPAAGALLEHGLRTAHREAVAAGRSVLDAIATNLAPCGTFWGQWTAAAGWGKGWTPGPDALHARTLAEAALFMTRAAHADPQAAAAWRGAIAGNARFVVAAQRADGRIPSAWNGSTGEPLSWAGTAGLAWVPTLIEAGRLFEAPEWTAAAFSAGAAYAGEVSTGSLRGAPEDVDLGPTSEDGYVAIMATVALATAADDPAERARWIRLARRAADWTLAFRWAYDAAFPPGTLLDRMGFRTRGADLASPANQHLHAYGLICTGELVELSRLTGDPHYARRARETFACFRQAIAARDGDLGGARRGMMPERLFQTRYDGPKGELGPLSHAWCLGLLLNAAELALGTPELADG
ncbi:MAG TPA: hypothetical protein VFJ71_14705 [Candidatus Limnocylindrales bacterium]|nr:hypothetical protein [Candidatus Limnocylindrales bacterium]